MKKTGICKKMIKRVLDKILPSFVLTHLAKMKNQTGKRKSQSREQLKSDPQSAFPFAQKDIKTMI